MDICTTEKYLQASKALLQARAIDAENPELHIRTIDFKQRGNCLEITNPDIF